MAGLLGWYVHGNEKRIPMPSHPTSGGSGCCGLGRGAVGGQPLVPEKATLRITQRWVKE